VRLDDTVMQSSLVRGSAPPGSTVTFAGRKLRLTDDGRFVIGFGRNSDPSADLLIRYPDGRTETVTLNVAQRSYDVQRIDGLPPGKVTPRKPEELAQIEREYKLIAAVKQRDTATSEFAGSFTWPVTGPKTGIFGSQRILNGKSRSPHRGVDVAAPEGTPVNAIAGGIVALARTGMYFTGGTIFLDHGHGVTSVYAHMSRIDVDEGQVIAPGQTIGAVGATGRVTGPHLHWGMYWFDRAIDPELLLGPMPGSTG
jgi:murein DD-endopeptidase MepM/ murein hydrolase activator NlpD